MRKILTVLAVILCMPAHAQQLLYQPSNSSALSPIPKSILERIDDPFFNIVLSANPLPIKLNELIDKLLEGGQSDFKSFVVGEQIGRHETSTECGETVLRLVLSFVGSHASTETVLDHNLFFSLFLSPNGTGREIEVIAWDSTNREYNYYKLEAGVWRFRNSSSEIRSASASDLSGGCLSCHVNGGPVMKEFTFPWNHWHGLPNTFEAPHLFGGLEIWPVAGSDIFGGRLTGAQTLEASIQSSLTRFVDSEVRNNITVDDSGSVQVAGLVDMLDSLFMPTELNLGSSNISSGLDGGGLTERAIRRINVPDSFFVNIFQMRDIRLPVFAGQGSVTNVFMPGDLGLSVEEYESILIENDVDTECMPGRDTIFPWFGPEPSEFDRRMVERLNKRRIIDDQFIASVLSIDFENPLFSEARASLLRHVPDSMSADSQAQVPEMLRGLVVSSLESLAAPSQAEQEFLTLLENPDSVSELNARVQASIDRIQSSLSDPISRGAILKTLFGRLLENREMFRTHPVSMSLNEFPGLLPQVMP